MAKTKAELNREKFFDPKVKGCNAFNPSHRPSTSMFLPQRDPTQPPPEEPANQDQREYAGQKT